MAKKRNRQVKGKEDVQENPWTALQVWSMVFCVSFLCVEFVPHSGKYTDIIYPQWLYLSALTFACLVFTVLYRDVFSGLFSRLIKSSVVRLYGLFIFFSGISLFNATNLPEGTIALGWIVLTFFIFIFLCFFLRQLKERFHLLAKLILFILLFQSIQGLLDFFSKAGSIELRTLLTAMADGFANKNIMAVSLLIKIPFGLFVFQNSEKIFWKILSVLTLVPAACLIFILNARATYVGFALVILIYIIIQAFSLFKSGKRILAFRNAAIALTLFLLTAVAADNILDRSSDRSVYGTIIERIKSINPSESSNRVTNWEEGLSLFKDHPALGVGEGNYKIDILKYRNKQLETSLVYPRRLHNDFLETAIETGIFGGLCYLSIFFCLLLYIIRTLRNTKDPFARQLALLALLAGTAYIVDAFFNFPMERPNMQTYLALLMAVCVTSSFGFDDNKMNSAKSNRTAAIWIPAALILACIAYINFITLKSSEFQYRYYKDKKALQQKADKVARQFPAFPTIDYAGQPIKTIKAIYYIKESRLQEAQDILDDGKNPNPYFLLEDHLRIQILMKTGKLDSAMQLALDCTRKAPKLYLFVDDIIKISLKKGEIQSAVTAVQDYLRRGNEQISHAWLNYAELINIQTRDFDKVSNILDLGLKHNPIDGKLLRKKLSLILSIKDVQKKLDALESYSSPDLEASSAPPKLLIKRRKKILQKTKTVSLKALEQRHLDYSNLEKLAVIEFHNKDYPAAIKYCSAIISRRIKTETREIEYLRGLCFQKLGQKEKACADFRTSAKKGYTPAREFLKLCD